MSIGIILLPNIIAMNYERTVFWVRNYLWGIRIEDGIFTLELQTVENIMSSSVAIFILPQFLFVIYMIRLYEEKTTGSRVFFSYIIGFFPILLFTIGNTIPIIWGDWRYAFRGNPLPVTLLLGMILIYFFPPRSTHYWIENETGHQWWTRTDIFRKKRD